MIPSVTDKAYLAAFIDAEGSIHMQPPRAKAKDGYTSGAFAAICVTNSYLPTLLWIQERWGGRLRQTRPRDLPPYKAKKDGWALFFRVAEQEVVLTDVIPFLREKRQRAEEVLIFHRRTKQRGRGFRFSRMEVVS